MGSPVSVALLDILELHVLLASGAIINLETHVLPVHLLTASVLNARTPLIVCLALQDTILL